MCTRDVSILDCLIGHLGSVVGAAHIGFISFCADVKQHLTKIRVFIRLCYTCSIS